QVECGFYGLFKNLKLDGISAVGAIAAIVGHGSITVIGHSLGSPIGIYLAYELARAGLKVRGRFFASPHPGDEEFAKLFDRTVADYVVYVNALDAVPHLPFGLGYCHLPKLKTI